ncbi:hypothetical protein C8Q70DRAFT_934898 [Cubamyces menziesii]|nr:hypothetical protein C8Q70DRAFT_934898 [Cubamyces menziesii]
MSDLTCMDSVQNVLKELVHDNTTTITFEDFLNRVLGQDNTAAATVPSAEREVVLRALEPEVQAGRITIDDAGLVSLSAVGLAHYDQRQQQLQATSTPSFSQTREQARADYIYAANIITQITRSLVGDTIDTMNYLEEAGL